MSFSSNFRILIWLMICHFTTIFCFNVNQACQFSSNQHSNQKCLRIDGSLCDLWCCNFCLKRKVCGKIKSLCHATSLMVKRSLLQRTNQTQRIKWSTNRSFCDKNEIWYNEWYDFGNWNYSQKFDFKWQFRIKIKMN